MSELRMHAVGLFRHEIMRNLASLAVDEPGSRARSQRHSTLNTTTDAPSPQVQYERRGVRLTDVSTTSTSRDPNLTRVLLSLLSSNPSPTAALTISTALSHVASPLASPRLGNSRPRRVTSRFAILSVSVHDDEPDGAVNKLFSKQH